MSKPIIAVDIDDVLSRTVPSILAFSNERWGHSHTLEDFNEQLSLMWQVNAEEAKVRWLEFMNSGTMEQYDVIPDARIALETLKQRYTLIAVTSRRESLLDITREWLDSNYPNIVDRVVGAQIYGEGKKNAHQLTKAEILLQLSASYLIDDQPKHCIGAAGVGVKGVLYGGYPWNRNVELPSGVVRCDNWPSVLEYFNGEK